MKKLTPALLALLAASTLQLAAADVRQGLVSYWPLDSITLANTIQDVVSTNDMFLVAMDANNLVPGKYGSALSFDGTNTYAYYQNFDLANNDTGLPISRGRTFSVLMWVNGPKASPADGRAFTEGASATTTPFLGLGKHTPGTTNSMRVFYRDNSSTTRVDSTSPTNGLPFDSQWHHVAWVANNGIATLYLDGTPYMTNTYTAGFSMGTLNTTTLGCLLRTSAALFYKGLLDDVAVWDRALSQAEVQNVMSNSIATPVPAFPPVFTVQPVGNTNLFVGDASFTLSGTVSTGRRPLTLQWQQNNVTIPNATSSTLTLTNLALTNSAAYTLIAMNASGSVTSTVAQVTVNAWPAPNLTNGMFAYWPLDELNGPKTPDVVSGYDMELVNIGPADIVPGRWTNAISFDGLTKALKRTCLPALEKVPLSLSTNSRTLSMWIKSTQTAGHMYAEASSAGTSPLTQFTLATGNFLTIYSRNDAGTVWNTATTSGATGVIADGNWHNIVYVQDARLSGIVNKVYIDGVLQPISVPFFRPITNANVMSIGALFRAGVLSNFLPGQMDDVAMWERALSPDEALLLATAPTPVAPPRLQPLAIAKFVVNVPAVRRGGTVKLSWDISTSAQSATINNGVGDILPRTSFGLGSTNVVVTNNTTFTLTIVRGSTVISNQLYVAVVDGIATGWSLIDDFDQHPAGSISGNNNRWWATSQPTAAIETRAGNHVAYLYANDGNGADAAFDLGPSAILEGQARTLFFRFWSPSGTNAVLTLRDIAGVTDKPLPFGFLSTNNVGPAVHFQTYTPDTTQDGTLQIGARNFAGSGLTWATTNTFAFASNTLYNVWIDVTNAPVYNSDVFSVWIAKDGVSTRTLLCDQFVSDRDLFDTAFPFRTPLDRLFLCGFYGNQGGIAQAFDDFYLSDSNYLSTVPRTYSYTGPLPNLQITRNGSQLAITWSVGTTLLESSSVNGPWTPVVGAVAPSYTFTPGSDVKFYRAAL